jgi:hypothetical protein
MKWSLYFIPVVCFSNCGDVFKKPNYPRKAQAPYNKINKNSVITEFKNSPIIGWVLVALDAEVRMIVVIKYET